MNKKILISLLLTFGLCNIAFAATPSVSMTYSPSYTNGAWTNQNITTNVTCTPNGTSTCSVLTCYDHLNTCLVADQANTTWSYTFNTEGTWYARYQATDGVGNNTAISSGEIKIDKTNPIGSITSPTNGSALSGSVTFETSVSDPGTTSGIKSVKLYRLGDSTAKAEATSHPYSLTINTTDYTNASHNFFITVEDNAGNVGTSTQVSVTISNTSPLTLTKTAGPVTSINTLSTTLSFDANKAGSFTISGGCTASASTFVSGSNTMTITYPGTGTYTCALNATASDSTTATLSLGIITIDTTAPTGVSFSSKPSSSTELNSASFTMSANETIGGIKYQLDSSGSWIELSGSTFTLSSLSVASHTINVQVKDVAGNWNTTWSTYTWEVVESTKPQCSLSSTPSNPTNSRDIDILVGGTNITYYKYKIDNEAYSSELPVSTRIEEEDLARGEVHYLFVLCKNANGEWQTTATEFSWKINTTSNDDDDDDDDDDTDSVSRYQFTKNLEYGDVDKDVEMLQRVLKKEGFYKYGFTGKFDGNTEEGLSQYQEEYGLTVSGILDQKTRDYLNKYGPEVEGAYMPAKVVKNVKYKQGYIFKDTIWKNKKGADVIELQKRLQTEGFYDGKLTGIMDKLTQDAISEYQEANNLDVMGILDDLTQRFMNSRAEAIEVKAPQYTFKYTRKLGNKGEDIKVLQEILNFEDLYKYKPNGYFTQNTYIALKKMQDKLGVKITGILDAATIAKLNTYYYGNDDVATVTTDVSTGFKFAHELKLGSKHDDITKLQIILQKSGYYKYKPSGKFTPGTVAALKAYQKSKGLEQTGELDLDTIDTLNSYSLGLLGGSSQQQINKPSIVTTGSKSISDILKMLLGQ